MGTSLAKTIWFEITAINAKRPILKVLLVIIFFLFEPVAQWFSNPTVGFDGCLRQMAQFSASHTAFVNFYLY